MKTTDIYCIMYLWCIICIIYVYNLYKYTIINSTPKAYHLYFNEGFIFSKRSCLRRNLYFFI